MKTRLGVYRSIRDELDELEEEMLRIELKKNYRRSVKELRRAAKNAARYQKFLWLLDDLIFILFGIGAVLVLFIVFVIILL